MNSWFKDIGDFQKRVLQRRQPFMPMLLTDKQMQENIACLNEEIHEILEAIEDQDLVGVADGIADLVYFALGFAWQMRLPFDDIWTVVHKANMAKVRGVTKRGHQDDAAKPDGWVDPREAIRRLL